MLSYEDLFLGRNVKITENISVHNPTVGEILEFGEDEYYFGVSLLACSAADYKVYLYDMGIDYEQISDFEFFCLFAEIITQSRTKLILGNLDLSKLALKRNVDTDTLTLVNEEGVVIIDEDTYILIRDSVRKIHGIIPRNAEKPLDNETKQYEIDKERFEGRWRKILNKPTLMSYAKGVEFYKSLPISVFSFIGAGIETVSKLKYC